MHLIRRHKDHGTGLKRMHLPVLVHDLADALQDKDLMFIIMLVVGCITPRF
jgi:hypothetical protein